MGIAALALGLLVLLVAGASQAGLLGGDDFLNVALAGLACCVFCTVVALEAHSRRAAVSALLSVVPLLLLAYFLSTSDG